MRRALIGAGGPGRAATTPLRQVATQVQGPSLCSEWSADEWCGPPALPGCSPISGRLPWWGHSLKARPDIPLRNSRATRRFTTGRSRGRVTV